MEIEIKVVDDFKVQLKKIENECDMYKKKCTDIQRDLDATTAILSAHRAKSVEFNVKQHEEVYYDVDFYSTYSPSWKVTETLIFCLSVCLSVFLSF
jgi:hypothetical protein